MRSFAFLASFRKLKLRISDAELRFVFASQNKLEPNFFSQLNGHFTCKGKVTFPTGQWQSDARARIQEEFYKPENTESRMARQMNTCADVVSEFLILLEFGMS